MTIADASPTPFDLNAYLSTYVPRHLTAEQWERVRAEAHVLLERINPTTRADATAHLATLARFLEDARGSQEASIGLLDGDAVARFLKRQQQAGVNPATLAQLRPRLNRLLRAKAGDDPRPARGQQRRRVAEFHPHSEDELLALSALGASLSMEEGRTLSIILELISTHGCRRGAVTRARVSDGVLCVGYRCIRLPEGDRLRELAADGEVAVTSAQWQTLRATVASATGISLRHHRLRHAWLLRVLSGQGSVATVMTMYGLDRDDVEVVTPFLPEPPDRDRSFIAM